MHGINIGTQGKKSVLTEAKATQQHLNEMQAETEVPWSK